MSLVQLASVVFVLLNTVQAFTIPRPRGPYAVASAALEVVDVRRPDPYTGAATRRLEVSSFYPVGNRSTCEVYYAPYMPPPTAAAYDEMFSAFIPNGTFESINLTLCRPICDDDRVHRDDVLLFSPGLGNSRLEYSAIAQALASRGWPVITIDHPGDAVIVTFPDGSITLAANISTVAQIEYDVEVRSADISFLVGEILWNKTLQTSLFPGIKLSNSSLIQLFGHSLGGASAAAALVNDSRPKSGVNLDGEFFGPVINEGVSKPFFLWNADTHNFSSDPTWDLFYNASTGPRIQAELLHSEHGSFTDFPLLAQLAGLNASSDPAVAQAVGEIPGDEIIDILASTLTDWFNFVLGRVGPTMLKIASNDVKIVRSNLVV